MRRLPIYAGTGHFPVPTRPHAPCSLAIFKGAEELQIAKILTVGSQRYIIWKNAQQIEAEIMYMVQAWPLSEAYQSYAPDFDSPVLRGRSLS